MLKIANWNLERALPSEYRVSAIGEQMAAVRADIWILTETHEAISPGDGFLAVTSGDPDRTSKQGERWVAIWSRSTIKPLPLYVSDSARCAAAHTIHADVGEIVVFACVLPWLGSRWKENAPKGGVAFAAALAQYRGDWERLRTAFPDAVLIVAGDFNQSLVDRHYYGSKLQRNRLETALAGTRLRVATAGAGDPIYREAKPYACIDHICITDSPAFRVRGTTRWPRTPEPDLRLSDHFGVAVELSRS